MKSFEEFEDRIGDLLAQVAGPSAGMEVLVRAKSGGGSRKRLVFRRVQRPLRRRRPVDPRRSAGFR